MRKERKVGKVKIAKGIYRDGDTWTIRVQFQKDGKTYDKKKQIVGITRQAAENIQSEMRVALIAEIKDLPAETKDTFKDYYKSYLDHLVKTDGMRESTRDIRLSTATQLIYPYFGHRPVSAITRKNVKLWQEWLSAKKKPNGDSYSKEYFKTAWRDLKSSFVAARDLIMLKENPTDKMSFSVKGNDPAEKEALTLEETKSLLAATADESSDIACMIWMAVTTGARYGEITALTWEDINFEFNFITISKSQVGGLVGKTKNKRSRFAPIHADLKPLLLAHREEQKKDRVATMSGIVFPSNVGTYRYPAVMVKPLANCCHRAGITKDISGHSLRRTCNNVMRVSLGDVAAQKMLGHVSASQTKRYSVVEPSELIDGQHEAFGSLTKKATDG